jgi:hypothetical protein
MTLHRTGIAACLLAAFLLAPSAQGAARKLPQAPDLLRVGYATNLPRPQLERSAAFRSALDLLASITEGGPLIRGQRAVEFDLALGTDYQVLQWLEDGSLDVGFVSAFAAHLFRNHPVGGRRATTFLAIADPEDPLRPLVLPEAPLPPGIRILERVGEGWRDGDEPVRRFGEFLDELLHGVRAAGERAPVPSLPYCLAIPSHLSTSGFIAPIAHARRWLVDEAKQPEIHLKFWRAFFRHVRYGLILGRDGLPARNACREGVTVFAFTPDGWTAGDGRPGAQWEELPLDGLPTLIEPGFLILTDRRFAAQALALTVTLPEIHPDLEERLGRWWADPALGKILRREFGRGSYFRSRNFRYTIEELLSILSLDQMNSGRGALSLILPGGGVKAAYQSLLIDHLYGEGHLVNRPDAVSARLPAGLAPPAAPGGPTLGVRHVIGNSGGALLGFFVSQLGPGDGRQLHEILLSNDEGETLTSVDIFGSVDIMRWISVLIHYGIFAILLLGATLPKNSPFRTNPVTDFSRVRVSLVAPLYLLALAAPYWIRPMVGEEHVPYAWGIFYFLFLILIYAAESIYMAAPRSGDGEPGSTARALLWYGLALAAAITARLAAGLQPVWLASMLLGGGLVTSAAAVIQGARVRSPRYTRVASLWTYACGISIPLLSLAIAYGIFWIFVKAGRASPLELTDSFWKLFVAISLPLSAVLIGIGYIRVGRKSPALKPLHDGLEFMAARHPAGRFLAMRLLRTFVFFSAGLIWWNVIVAPGLYGNSYARSYLEGVMERFESHRAAPASGRGGSPAAPAGGAELRTFYVAPANSLKAKKERYFVSPPDADPDWELPFEISGDERWEVIRDRSLLKKIIFASGSPFPIFPPHFIEMDQPSAASAGSSRVEELVDGGYAHNIPVEAAKQMGARQALIIRSENPDIPSEDVLPSWLAPGLLVTNLPRLLPFMFEQSQTPDALSREDLLVASLAPSWSRPGWPKLFDFRRSVVEWMHREASADLHKRIGRVESWGKPRFIYWVRQGHYLQHDLSPAPALMR